SQNNNSISEFEDLDKSYSELSEYMNRSMMNTCGNLIMKVLKGCDDYNTYEEYEKQLFKFLESINYVSINDEHKINIEIPVFDKSDERIVKDIAKIILPNIKRIVIKFFNNIEKNSKDITAIKHNVDIKEVGNELRHLVFGVTNEQLVKYGFVKESNNNEIEGRYLQSLYKV
ncbi:MAG: hypothetical protein ACRCXT_21560, partial [Paraclostridium sp.]